MKIEADVLGVEQAVDFSTMETKAFVVVELLGEILRVPISEEQMERLTVAAIHHRTGPEEAFEETRSVLPVGAKVATEQLDDQPEREFSVMEGLTDMSIGFEDREAPTGLEGLFGDPNEEAKIAKLRQRPPPIMSVPRDDAGNPLVEQYSSSLPRMPGLAVQDDDFPQG